MYNKAIFNNGTLTGITAKEGEPIERKMSRILDENSPLTEGAPIIYTERKDGVKPEFDIRTDKWEIATAATTKKAKAAEARRAFGQGERSFDTMTPEEQAAHIKQFPDSKFNTESKA